jgi:hypothetical protein
MLLYGVRVSGTGETCTVHLPPVIVTGEMGTPAVRCTYFLYINYFLCDKLTTQLNLM